MLSDSLPMFSYQAEVSPVSRLEARFKVLGTIAIVVGVVVARDVRQFLLLSALILAGLIAARLPLSILWGNVRPVLAFIVIGGAITVFASPGHGESLGPFHVSYVGLTLTARVSTQLLLLLFVTTVLTYTTSPFALASGLRRLFGFLEHVHVPVEEATTMLTIALTFIPIMSREVDRYLTARAARGASVRRLGLWSMLGDLIVPLIESNLSRGEELAEALETRLYGYAKRTHRGDRPADPISAGVLLAIVVIVSVALVLL